MMIRVVLADDHEIMREGLRLILQRMKDVQVVGEARDGREAVELAEKLVPHIIVLDIGMPNLNGVEAARRIASLSPEVKVVALSAMADRRYVMGMLQAGACGYLVKSSAGDELEQAIRSAISGRRFISPQLSDILADQLLHPGSAGVSSDLAPREREVLQLLAEGRSSKEVARALHISSRTVETHRRNIMAKLNLHSVAELTRYAIREGIILP